MKIIVYNTFSQLINIKSAIAIHNDTNNHYYIYFIKNGKAHNLNFHAEYINNSRKNLKSYYYNGSYYGAYQSVKQWKKQAKQLKRTHNLKVFL